MNPPQARVAVQDLAAMIFDDKQVSAILTQVGHRCGFPSYNGYSIKTALEKLEYFVNKSKAKCLQKVKGTWRAQFEATEVYRRLPERLIEEARERKEQAVQTERATRTRNAQEATDLRRRMGEVAVFARTSFLRDHPIIKDLDASINKAVMLCQEQEASL